MRISLDVDGVMADFVYAFTKELAHFDPTVGTYNTSQQKEWWFDTPKEDYEDTWSSIKYSFNWWMTVPPLVVQEDVDAINQVAEKHEVFFITSRTNSRRGLSAQEQTKYWLEGIGIHRPFVIATKGSRKAELLDALDIDYHLDDKVSVIIDIHRRSKAWSCILDQPYNSRKHLSQADRGAQYLSFSARFNTVEEYIKWTMQNSRELEKNSIPSVRGY